MKRNNVLRSTQGFTLVELAIVLVIIGLIIAGVMKGRTLIDSSRAKNVAGQLMAVQGGAVTFHDRFPVVPFAVISTTHLANMGFVTGIGGTVNRYSGAVYIAQATTAAPITPLAIVSKNIPGDIAEMVDAQLDDGNPATGSVRAYPTTAFVPGTLAYPTGTVLNTSALTTDPAPIVDLVMTFSY